MTISFEDWQKLDLRVGKILSAEDHPNADKLFILGVDIGTERRMVVAGLRKHYTKEQLIGKKVALFVNLEPVLLRGVKSEGMVLAAVDEEEKKVVLLTLEQDIEQGAHIR